MPSFDLISDIHLDFWYEPIHSNETQIRKIRKLFQSLIPASPSKVLVIAGDMGHYNKQNFLMLEHLKEFYEYILIVQGNHDLYRVSRGLRRKFFLSHKRWDDMKERASVLEGVHFLEGNTIEIDGVTYGGTGMWYDYSFGLQQGGYTHDELEELWKDKMNDINYINGLPDFIEEKKKLANLIDQNPDVIITHVGPDWIHAKNEYVKGIMKSFYFFDGQEFLDRCEGKIWCFGHTHEHYSYMYKGCRLENNAMGYPGRDNKLNATIRTIAF